MSSSRRRGRRVPPKHGARPLPPLTPSGAPSRGGEAASGAGGEGGAASTEAARQLTRSQNRAAKRAATGVQAKRVRGRVSGRKSRSYNPALLGLAVAAVVVGAGVFLLGNPFGGPTASASPAGSQTPLPTRLLTGCPTAAPAGLAPGTKRTVTIDTRLGKIVLEVDADLAPVAAANFIALAECDYFNGVVFHRVIPDFVIQGGDGQYGWSGGIDRANVGSGGPGYEFADEPVIGAYTRGTLAMANSGADTNGSQFFIVVKDQSDSDLAKNYTIFGHVTAGMDVVDQIVGAPRDSRNFPNDPVAMTTVTVAPVPSSAPSAAASPSASPAPGPTSSPEQPQP